MLVSEPAGLEVVVVVVLVVVSEALPLGLAAGAAVSVFCSQAANNMAPIRMQISLFISVWSSGAILGRC